MWVDNIFFKKLAAELADTWIRLRRIRPRYPWHDARRALQLAAPAEHYKRRLTTAGGPYDLSNFFIFFSNFWLIFGKLWEVRSRLYRSRVLQLNITSRYFLESSWRDLRDVHNLAPFRPQKFNKNRRFCPCILAFFKICKNHYVNQFSQNYPKSSEIIIEFVVFRVNVDEQFSEFHGIRRDFVGIIQTCWNWLKFCQ